MTEVEWSKYSYTGDKVRAVEEMLKQTEEDADKEILEMKTGYEIDLKREAESNVKLRWAKIGKETCSMSTGVSWES